MLIQNSRNIAEIFTFQYIFWQSYVYSVFIFKNLSLIGTSLLKECFKSIAISMKKFEI